MVTIINALSQTDLFTELKFWLSLHALLRRDSKREEGNRRQTREGTLFLGGGGRAGASEGRVISEREHQKGRAIPHVSYSRERHTSFPEFLMRIFCGVAFHFSYTLSFSFHLL